MHRHVIPWNYVVMRCCDWDCAKISESPLYYNIHYCLSDPFKSTCSMLIWLFSTQITPAPIILLCMMLPPPALITKPSKSFLIPSSNFPTVTWSLSPTLCPTWSWIPASLAQYIHTCLTAVQCDSWSLSLTIFFINEAIMDKTAKCWQLSSLPPKSQLMVSETILSMTFSHYKIKELLPKNWTSEYLSLNRT